MIIILGNVVAVMYGSKSTENYDLNQLYELLFGKLFLIYSLIIIILTIVLQLYYLYCKYRLIPTKNSFVNRFVSLITSQIK